MYLVKRHMYKGCIRTDNIEGIESEIAMVFRYCPGGGEAWAGLWQTAVSGAIAAKSMQATMRSGVCSLSQ